MVLAAQDDAPSPDANVQTPETSGKQAPAATPTIQTSLGKYGDPGGIRAYLDAKGIDYSFTYIGEVLGNSSGGAKQGATYEGRLDANLDIDLEKLAGFKGAAVHAEAFQIHGRGLTGNNLLDNFTASGIEAYPSTKLYEAWYEQKLYDGKIFVRLGQLAADTEFFISQTATLFVNSSFGFPAILANDLPNGGPAYPLATPGARFKFAVNGQSHAARGGVRRCQSAGPYIPGVNAFLPQVRDLNGTLFRTDDNPLIFTEAQYVYNQEQNAKGLPGTIKIGYVHDFGRFAATNVTGNVSYRGSDNYYGIIDQTIYRKPGTDDQGASVFVRLSGTPQDDRNLINFYVDGGLSYKGLIPGRPDDTVGVSGAYARVSPDVSYQDQIGGAAPLVRDFTGLIEATYQYVVLPGFTVQPDFQYLFHPSAHAVAIPNVVPTMPLHDAAVFGLRATLHY